ncbi:MAG: L-lysine dehydrogenase, partial [Crocinitomicaceae bacterium]|nr:L-lysine dehydrogenase [Crocinitomicaceae bacterium]
MEKTIQSLLVIGLGKVGSLVAILLHENGYGVTGLAREVNRDVPFKLILADSSDLEQLKKSIAEHDAVVSCLPYHLNLNVAEAAHVAGK